MHLEQLPAYEPAREAEQDDEPRILSPVPVRPSRTNTGEVARNTESLLVPPPAPDEAPPGYEEAQVQAVGSDLERRLTEAAERA